MSVLNTIAPRATPSHRAPAALPVVGLARFIWQKNRIGFYALASTLLLEAVLAHIPVVHSNLSLPFFLISLVGVIIYVFVAFTVGDGDLSAVESSYPPHLLRLPVRTSALTLWPLAFGTVALTVTYFFIDGLVVAPFDLQLPFFWPAAMLVALFAWLQAILWYPLPLPYLRPFIVLPLIPFFIGVPAFASLYHVPEGPIVGALLLLTALALPVAIAGVGRGRCGNMRERSWGLSLGNRVTGTHELPPFPSAMQAQCWAEWRQNGLGLPAFVAADCLMVTIILLGLRDPSTVAYPGGILVEGALPARIPLIIVGIAPLLASLVGCGLKATDTRRKDFSVPVFLAVRPMTSMDIVVAKVRTAMRSGLTAWAVVLAFAPLWLLMIHASDAKGSGSLLMVLLRHFSLTAVYQGLAILLVAILVTFKNQTDGLFANLTGKPWLAIGYAFGLSGLIMATVVAVLETMIIHPEWQGMARAALPYLIAAAIAGKMLLGGMNLLRLYGARQVGRGVLIRLAVVWPIVAAGLPWLVKYVLLGTLLPGASDFPVGYLYAGVILLCLPLGRLTLAPLALEANRRR